MKYKLSMGLLLSLFTLQMASTALADDTHLVLSGNNEVPPVTTMAAGSGDFTIAPDKTISGSVNTQGMTATMAHIHTGKAGKNGPITISLVREGDNVWKVPAGTKLTDMQYQAYMDGDLYVNVHSEMHKGGELRAQLMPPSMAMPNRPAAMPAPMSPAKPMPPSMPMERKGY